MQERVAYAKVAPATIVAMRALDQYVTQSGLEPALLDLVKIRASQLNGCAYCIDMHTKDARARGESEQRLYALPVWHETPFFTERERAALAWTEAITLLSGHRVTDELYQAARPHFGEKQLVVGAISSSCSPGRSWELGPPLRCWRNSLLARKS
jgi:AhpD family alkylhydroperoxidase